MSTTWILAADPRIGSLVEIGRELGGTVTAIAVGCDPATLKGVDRVISVSVPHDMPAEAAGAGAVHPPRRAEDPDGLEAVPRQLGLGDGGRLVPFHGQVAQFPLRPGAGVEAPFASLERQPVERHARGHA